MKNSGVFRGALLALIFVVLVISAGAITAEPAKPTLDKLNVEKVGFWSTKNVIDLNVLGNTAFVTRYFDSSSPVSGHFSTVDVGDPANPQENIPARLDAIYDEIFHAGFGDESFSYVAEDDINGATLQVQVYRREDQKRVCWDTLPNTNAVDIWAAGDNFFVALGGQFVGAHNGLYIYDRTPDPTWGTCNRLDGIKPNSEVTAAATLGNYAYLGTAAGELWIVDISDPLLPSLKSSRKFFDGRIEAIAAAPGSVYLAQGNMIKIVDVANAVNPGEVNSFSVAAAVRQMAAAGDYLYLLSAHALDVIEVSDPNRPDSAGYYVDAADGRFGDALYLANDLIYTAGPDGMNILQFTPGEAPRLILQPTTPGIEMNGQEMPYPCQLPGSNPNQTERINVEYCSEFLQDTLLSVAEDSAAYNYVDCSADFIMFVYEIVGMRYVNQVDSAKMRMRLANLLLNELCEKKADPAILGGAAAHDLETAVVVDPHIVLELQEGPLRYRVAEELLALDIQTSTVTVHSRGANDFSVFHLPDTNRTEIASYGGTVEVEPSNGSLPPVTLNSGQMVTVTQTQIGPVTDIKYLAHMPVVVADAGSAPPSGWQTIVQEDFEAAFPGTWSVYDDLNGYGEYHWGKRDCRAFAGSRSAWAVGSGADGGSLSCGSSYPDNAKSWMIYGPFSLADAAAAEISMRYWLDTGAQGDFLFWGASTDGSNFNGWQTWGDSGGWEQAALDLSVVPSAGDLTGESAVWIGFLFATDANSNNLEGAYVDDILLRKYSNVSSLSTPSLEHQFGAKELGLKTAAFTLSK